METPLEVLAEFRVLPPHFYGSVEITMQDGEAVLIKTTTTKKLHTEMDIPGCGCDDCINAGRLLRHI